MVIRIRPCMIDEYTPPLPLPHPSFRAARDAGPSMGGHASPVRDQCQASVSFGLRKYQGKSGVKRLFRLLVEEFGGETAGKRQIALLFALLDADQPVENIKSLMGETDNSSVVRCNFFSGRSRDPPPSLAPPRPLRTCRCVCIRMM